MIYTPRFIKIFLAVFLILVIGYFVSFEKRKWKRTFNSEQWKNWKETEKDAMLRMEMIGSLMMNLRFNSRGKKEIIDILGEPNDYDENKFRYFLSMSGTGINTGALIIYFNASGNSTNIEFWEG